MKAWRKLGTFFHWLSDSEKSLDDFRKKVSWREDELIAEPENNQTSELIALTAHVFYKEFARDVIEALKVASNISKVYVSTPSSEIKDLLLEYLATSPHKYDVRVTPNIGRNFGPLFVEFSKDLLKESSFIHVHSKGSLHSPRFAKTWLNRNTDLLLSENGTQRVLSLVTTYSKIGLVFVDASDLLNGTNFRWGRSRKVAKQTFADMKGVEGIKWSGRLSFPAGGMFWVRTKAIRPLLEMDWTYEMFPQEKGQMDGTLQHALERIIGQAVLTNDFDQAVYLSHIGEFKAVS
jgi:lipopolysaccharide biosynthesis protein